MANLKSDDSKLHSTGPTSTVPAVSAAKFPLNKIDSVRLAIARLARRPVLIGLAAAVICAALIAAGYLVLHATRKPAPEAKRAPPPPTAWKPIAERVQQAAQGQFPVSEGILTVSLNPKSADGEIRSVVGTYALPDYGAAQLESGESWGVTGQNRDEFVMYVHNFLSAPLTAMIVRISEGSCAAYTPQTPATWASAYWADALQGGKEAIFHATLPSPHNLPSYCAVIYKAYTNNAL